MNLVHQLMRRGGAVVVGMTLAGSMVVFTGTAYAVDHHASSHAQAQSHAAGHGARHGQDEQPVAGSGGSSDGGSSASDSGAPSSDGPAVSDPSAPSNPS